MKLSFSYTPLSLSEAHRRRAARLVPLPFSSPVGPLSGPERDENEESDEVLA